jgi:hypothetical protein
MMIARIKLRASCSTIYSYSQLPNNLGINLQGPREVLLLWLAHTRGGWRWSSVGEHLPGRPKA